MDRKNYEYIATTLISVDFKKSILKKDLEISYSAKPKFNKTNDIIIKGTVDFLADDKVIGFVKMRTIFKNQLVEEKAEKNNFSNFNLDDQIYFMKPLLSELSLFIANLTEKAARIPLIIPIEQILDNIEKT